jgi:GNAT superfamily N-acetyltransferase
MVNRIFLRKLNLSDENFIWKMLMYASHEVTVDDVKNSLELARYAKDWGRTGDTGFVAVEQDKLVGAAWIRLWSDTDQGFGYLGNQIPELVVATLPEYRSRGVGTLLITTLIHEVQSSKYPGQTV